MVEDKYEGYKGTIPWISYEDWIFDKEFKEKRIKLYKEAFPKFEGQVLDLIIKTKVNEQKNK